MMYDPNDSKTIVFNRPFAYTPTPEQDVEYPPSVTLPNLSMSVAEILRRYTKGEPIPREVMGSPTYNNGVLSPLSKKGVDLCDWSEIKKSNEATIVRAIADANESSEDKKARERQVEVNSTSPTSEEVAKNSQQAS